MFSVRHFLRKKTYEKNIPVPVPVPDSTRPVLLGIEKVHHMMQTIYFSIMIMSGFF